VIERYRKCATWWVAIVLPGFLLRALIPIGFMPMFGPGLHLSLMLCQGYAPLPPSPVPMTMAIDMPMAMPMPMPMAADQSGGAPHLDQPDRHDPQDHQDHSVCPYGAAPALAAMAAWIVPSLRVRRPPDPRAATPQLTTFALFPRAQSPRGPPIEV
jgi:hypothetical protein